MDGVFLHFYKTYEHLLKHLKVTENLLCLYFTLQLCNNAEKKAIDIIIDTGPQMAGDLDKSVVHSK